MGRYDLPDPLCTHVPSVRVSSHEDLSEGLRSTTAPFASTYCCVRQACQEDAKKWVQASTKRSAVFVVPLEGR
jgi:hypothetical protein